MALSKNLLFSLLFLLPTTLHASPLYPRDDSVVQEPLATDTFWNDYDGGADNNYTFYSGDGSAAAGWPNTKSWVSFNDMWISNQHVMQRSCDIYYNTTNNSGDEMTDLYYAIRVVSQETRVDHRFILAAVMQETKGCVRAATSTSPNGIRNPGMLQDFEGTFSCNDNGKVQSPCPQAQILGMIRDGVAGTSAGAGFAQNINAQSNYTDRAQAYYRAARLYNSGAIDDSGDLGKGSATHCYASDIANRMTGWVDATSTCTLDTDNKDAAS